MKSNLFKLLFFLNFIICSYSVFAQNDSLYLLYIDSLKQTLPAAPNDTNKVGAYSEIADFYQWSNPDSSLLYALPGIALAKKLNFMTGEYDLLLPISEALSIKGNYSKALEYRFRGIELADQFKNPEKIANSLALTGLVYSRAENYDKALEYFYKAQKTNVETLGGPQFLKGFIGEAYFNLHKWDSALLYIQTAYNLDIKDTNFHWSEPYQYLAAIYEQKGNFIKAISLYKLSFNYSFSNNDILKSYNGIASVYQKTGQTDSAIFYAKQVIGLGTRVSINAPLIDASRLLVKIYKSRHEIDSAFKYQEILLTYQDSLFSQEKIKQLQNVTFNEQLREQEIIFEKDRYENRIKQYALIAALTTFIIIGLILWRNNKTKQRSNTLLQHQKKEIELQKEKVESTLSELKSTQQQLIQSEKMASLGELTAGIAHEIQNPLNFVNNFSEVSNELIDEMKEELKKGDVDEAKFIADDIKQNLEKINHHGKRADAIVKGMLQHSRQTKGVKEPTDINALCDEYIRLSFHGMRAKDKNFNAEIKTDFDESIRTINVVPQDIGRVLLNLFNNAFYAVNEKFKANRSLLTDNHKPTVSVQTKKINDRIEIKVADNGNGIQQNIIDKIFQPFFTTKPTGQGTGLGLSLAYDIITKEHNGIIKVESKEGEGTAFIISLS
ncbi:MAG TPA: ATP-binding protein [Parafilimonas sp.]|nr:ATP-binding protein [Parafilimonas sp.]